MTEPRASSRPAPAAFVVLSTQRSGSNWLEDRLDAHAEIAMVRSEPFRRSGEPPRSYRAFRQASRPRMATAALLPPVSKWWFLRSCLHDPPGDGLVGMRVMYDQLRRNPSLLVLGTVSRTPMVHLVRENVLATHVSALAARQTGVFLTRGQRESPPVELDPATLVGELRSRQRRIERHRRLLALMRLPHLEVTYEGYVADPDHHDAAVFDFLGLAPAPVGTSLQRQGAAHLRDRVRNWNHARAVLAGSEFAWMLDGP